MSIHSDFLQEIFRHKDDDHYVNVFSLKSRKSTYHLDPGKIGSGKSHTFQEGQDHYFGLCTLLTPKSKGRVKIEETAGAICLWMDIDREKYEGDPAKIFKTLSVQPSVCVGSGLGIHAYWLLDEYQRFDTQAERDWFARVIQGWQVYVNEAFGGKLDKTADLARVLRIPGTFNHKYKPPKLVTVQGKPNYKRYSIAIFENYAAPAPGTIDEPARIIGDIKIHPAGDHHEKLMEKLRTDPNFNKTFLHDRPDLRDQSPSAIDFCLCIFGIKWGWTDEEIINTMIAGRRAAKRPLQLDRIDSYYKKTLQAAYKRYKGKPSEPDYHPANDNPDDNRKYLSKRLGMPIASLIKDGVSDSQYSLKLTDGKLVIIGPVKTLTSMVGFRNRIVDTLGVYVKLSSKDWFKVVQSLLAITVLREHEEESEEAQAISLLTGYLSNTYMVEGRSQGLKDGKPFREDGKYYLDISNYKLYLTRLFVKPEKFKTSIQLIDLGFEQVRVQGTCEYANGKEEVIRKRLFSISVKDFNELRGLMGEPKKAEETIGGQNARL